MVPIFGRPSTYRDATAPRPDPPSFAPLRLFASQDDAPRARRPSDAVRVLVALGTLVVAAALRTTVPGPFESATGGVVAEGAPGILAPVWRAGYALLVLWPTLLLLVALVARRRWRVVRDMLLGAVLAGAVVSAITWLFADGATVTIDALWHTQGPADAPALRVAVGVAALVAAVPHLGRPVRRLTTVVIVWGSLASIFLDVSRPVDMVAAILAGTAGGAFVLWAFGSPSGHPRPEVIRAALAELGVDVDEVHSSDQQPDGVYRVAAEDADGPLWVAVYGRDARDAAAVGRLWSALWYREGGATTTLGRLHQVEHEATMTLLAEDRDVAVPRVVTVGRTDAGDALLVLRPNGAPLRQVPDPAEPVALVAGYWHQLGLLHAAGIAHGSIDPWHLGVTAQGGPCFVGLGTASIPANDRLRASDAAQLLAASADLIGPDAAVAEATRALGVDGLAEVQPYLQPAVVGVEGDRRAARTRLDALSEATASSTGIENPKLQQLRRFTWGSLLQIVLLFAAGYAIMVGVGGLDLASVADELRDASWAILVVALIVGQLVRVPAGWSTLGASPAPLPLGPTVVLQYAIAYINLAVPSTAARVAINIRYFQKLGIDRVRAVSIGALDSVAGFAVQIALLLTIWITGASTLDIERADVGDISFDGALTTGVLVAAVLLVVAVIVVFAVPRTRRWILDKARDAWSVLQVLRAPRKVVQLFGGNLTAQCLSAATVGLCVRALGSEVSFVDLLAINTMVSLFAGLMPVPGGIGVTEAALTAGLSAAGIPQDQAFAAALLTRVITFYLPPIWGFFSLRWLQHRDYL